MRAGGVWWAGFPPRLLRPASLGRRFVAAQVNGWPGAVVGILEEPLHLTELDERRQGVVVVGGALALVALDLWVARVVLDRQSLGTAVAGIELVTLDGRRASLPRFVVRHVGPAEVIKPLRRRLLGPKPPVRWRLAEPAASFAVGTLVVLLREDRRSVGDLVAGTRFVRVR